MEEPDPPILSVRAELLVEEEKWAGWAAENERRRHNYLPFCVEYLRRLAGSGEFEVQQCRNDSFKVSWRIQC